MKRERQSMDRLFVAILTALISTSGCGGSSAANLIRNPGFETCEGEEPVGWVRAVGTGIDTVLLGVTDDDAR
jgi:hypothetical protein